MFNLGKIIATRSILDTMENNDKFYTEVMVAMNRYIKCDWGNLCDEDKEINDRAVKNDDDRILAAYNTSKGRIWIITEWDRSCTTVLFPNEY